MTASWLCQQEGGVAVLELQRPPINALDQAARDELSRARDEIERAATVRALILTGGAQGIFCAGGDYSIGAESPMREK